MTVGSVAKDFVIAALVTIAALVFLHWLFT